MMWSRTIIISVIFSCYNVLGGEIFDITTVYDIGLDKSIPSPYSLSNDGETSVELPEVVSSENVLNVRTEGCFKDVTGRIYSRTNALGLGVVNEKIEQIDYKASGLLTLTCDANDFNEASCSQWGFTKENKWIVRSSAGIPTNGTAYRMKNYLNFKIHNKFKGDNYLFFTRGAGNLGNENIYMVIRFYYHYYGYNYGDIYYSCSGKYRRGTLFEAVDRDGDFTEIYCENHYTSFSMSSEDYLTFTISNDGNRFLIYTGQNEPRSKVIDWSYYKEGPWHINYFSLTTNVKDASSFTFVREGFEANGEIVSPVFIPESSNICIAISFHSSISSPSSELNIYALGVLPSDRRLLHTISDFKDGWNIKVVNASLDNLSPIKLSIEKSGSAVIHIARIVGCNPEGEEVIELPSPTTFCRSDNHRLSSGETGNPLFMYTTYKDLFDPVKVTNATHKCWNGGVQTTGGCACTPGFSGSSCEIGCGRNRFGHDCEGFCSFHNEECRGLLLCTRSTGCHCAPGYYGDDCTKACLPGSYGNDCSEQCGHCAGDSVCDIYTGECLSCEDGYLAPHCQTASVYYASKPEVTSPSYGVIVISFDPNNYITEDRPPQLYQIQFREKNEQWKVHTSKSLQKSNPESEDENELSETIGGLKTGVLYELRVLFIDSHFLKYDGDLVQVAEVLTKCDIPSSYDYKVSASSNTTAVTFTWKYLLENQNWCPLETFEVTWVEGWKSRKMITKHNDFTVNGLVPGMAIKFKVRAETSGGFAPYSQLTTTYTQQSQLPPVRHLHIASSQSTSVEVSWEPPRGLRDSRLRYTISYKCVDRPACSTGCQDVGEGEFMQEGRSITLSSLLPFTKYIVTVNAEGGVKSSVYAGTTKVVPTEVPRVSEQKHVRTNTSVTLFWDHAVVCTGYLLGYNYQLTKASDSLKVLGSSFTRDTNASFYNLTASTEYVVKVFVVTVAGWNPLSYLAINISTSATVPDAVRNLTVYKRGRAMLGLRWAEPRATYGQLKSFTVTHALGQEVTSHTVEPSRCVVWPDLYCYTIEGLRSNRRYNVSVSARNSEVAEDGQLASVSAVTKESPPSAPVNLKVTNCSTSSIELEWNSPEMANGIVRSFLISVEETEKHDQDNCCQIYPFVETSVKEESRLYSAEVSGLHPASTYFVSVSGKTVGLGPSQSLVAYTRPPHLPLTSLPTVQEYEVTWLAQDKLPEVNNSDIYSALVRAHLLLAVVNETQLIEEAQESAITDPNLNSLLQQKIEKPFYFIAEYNQDDVVELTGSLEESTSSWGQTPQHLPLGLTYQLVAAQVLEYNGVYNVDLRYTQPFTL